MKIKIEGKEFTGFQIPTEHTSVLMIVGAKGFIACGYINLDVANKRNDACAIITGVKTLNDLLNTEVKAISKAAAESGVKIGMTGQEALIKMS